MNKLSAKYKGLIVGILMIITYLLIYKKGNFDDNLQLLLRYGLYIGGIIWTLISFHNSSPINNTFRNYFSEGFKYFIIVTLLMVIFYFIFLKMTPGIKEKLFQQNMDELKMKGDKTPAEINSIIEDAKKHFITMFTFVTIFGHMIVGALVTAIISSIMIRNKKTVNQA